jgi:hypothetical protein
VKCISKDDIDFEFSYGGKRTFEIYGSGLLKVAINKKKAHLNIPKLPYLLFQEIKKPLDPFGEIEYSYKEIRLKYLLENSKDLDGFNSLTRQKIKYPFPVQLYISCIERNISYEEN